MSIGINSNNKHKIAEIKLSINMLLELLLALTILISFLTFWIHKKLNYWSERGIPQTEVKWPWNDEFLTKKKHLNDLYLEHSQTFKDVSFYGTYFLVQPQLVITDPDIVKQIFVKDFDNFVSPYSKKLNSL